MRTLDHSLNLFRVTSFALAASGMLASCAFVSSRTDTLSPGVSYYLPLRLTKMTFTMNKTLDTLTQKCETIVSLVITPGALVADQNHRFVAALDHNYFRTDDLTIVTTEQGLLSSSNGTAADQSGATLVALVQSAVASSGNGKASTNRVDTVLSVAPPAAACVDPKLIVERVFNPLDSGQLTQFETEIQTRAKINSFKVSIRPLVIDQEKPSALVSAINVASENTKNQRFAGLAYRRDRAYIVELSQGVATLGFAGIDLPQGAPIEMLEFKSSFGTTVTLNAGFDKGMLTSHVNKRPSEALAIAAIPFDVAKAALEVPATLLKLKVINVTEENNLSAQLLKQICAEEKLAALRENRAVRAGYCPP